MAHKYYLIDGRFSIRFQPFYTEFEGSHGSANFVAGSYAELSSIQRKLLAFK